MGVAQHTLPRDIFQCKENHFETRPFHAKFEENRKRNAKDRESKTNL